MKVLENIVKAIGKVGVVKEILTPELAGAQGHSVDPDDHQFRRITQTKRDLDPLSQERSINISHYLYERNGLYTRLIDIAIHAIKAADFSIRTENERIEEVWTSFWDRPFSGWRKGMPSFFDLITDVKLGGEANWPIAVNPANGFVERGYIDPINIKGVRLLPGNVMVSDQVIEKNKMGHHGRTFNIIRPRQMGALDGDIFHFPINKPINGSRGRPALINVLDQVDLYDQALFTEAERQVILTSHVFHVTLEGTKEKEQRSWLAKHFPQGRPPKKGTVRVSNEKEKWEQLTPNLAASDGTKLLNVFRQNIAGMAGYPDFFMGWGGDVNVATAREMMKSTIWMIQNSQKFMTGVLTTVFAHQLVMFASHGLQTGELGMLTFEDILDEWEIVGNNVFPRDFVLQASAFQQGVATLGVAKAQKLVGPKLVRRMFVKFANELGFGIDQGELEEEFEDEELMPVDPFGNPQMDENPAAEDDRFSMAEKMRMSKAPKPGKKRKKVYALN